ncbi:MAG: hypothetical protein ACOCZQ_02940 [Nanoarchaeota archaeon]
MQDEMENPPRCHIHVGLSVAEKNLNNSERARELKEEAQEWYDYEELKTESYP